MNDVYQLFKDLSNKPLEDGCYAADSVPFACQHKIGVSSEGYPTFLLRHQERMRLLILRWSL